MAVILLEKWIHGLQKALKLCNCREQKVFSIRECITSCCDVQSDKPLNLSALQEQLVNSM